jgi:uncharacterized membrane protein YfcA
MALRGGDVRSNRGVVQGFILFTSALSFAWVARKVGVDAGTLTALWWSLPFVCVGGWLGLRVFSRLDTRRFNQVLLWLVGACGVLISVQALRSW